MLRTALRAARSALRTSGMTGRPRAFAPSSAVRMFRTSAEEYESMRRRSACADGAGEEFWKTYARSGAVEWEVAPETALVPPPQGSTKPLHQWFPDGEINVCHNVLDRHVAAGRGDQAALIYDSAVGGQSRTLTYNELLEEVAVFAGGMRDQGVQKGDRVLIYMPMVPEAIVAMLACARIGAVHSVVFGGFAAPELAVRIDDARPSLIVSASGGLERGKAVSYAPLLSDALALAEHRPDTVVFKSRPEVECVMDAPSSLQTPSGTGMVDWDAFMSSSASNPSPCVPCASSDPFYILYTSGTTGQPKGILRDHTHPVSLHWVVSNTSVPLPSSVPLSLSPSLPLSLPHFCQSTRLIHATPACASI